MRFKSVSDSSDSDNNHIDLTKDSDDEDTAVPRKRAKTSSATADSAPKWSNPDPYTALPPPETLGAPKKDIVQVIRKAKMDTGPKQEGDSAVKGNDDFISFDDMDTANDDTTQQAEAPHPAAPAPSSTFSHRENPHNQHGGGAAGKGIKPASRVSGAPMSANSASAGPPAPPLGVVLPTDEELAAMNIHPHRGAKRKYRDTHDLGDVVDEWIGHEGQNTTPWLVVDHSPTAKPGLR